MILDQNNQPIAQQPASVATIPQQAPASSYAIPASQLIGQPQQAAFGDPNVIAAQTAAAEAKAHADRANRAEKNIATHGGIGVILGVGLTFLGQYVYRAITRNNPRG